MVEKEIQRQSILYEMNFYIVVQRAGKKYAKGYNFPFLENEKSLESSFRNPKLE